MPQAKARHPEGLTSLLVDIDGTLIDSNDAHTRAWMSALKSHGYSFAFEQVRPLIGKGGDKLLAELLGPGVNANEQETISTARGEIFVAEELHRLVPTIGARELLLAVRSAGLKIVVATSAQPKETIALLKQAGIDDLIDDSADSGDANNSKPDPDIVRSALRKAGCRPASAIVLGDTPYDVEAAARAGVSAIMLRCGGWWNDSAFAGATAVYDSPRDLLDSMTSPLRIRAR